MFALDKDQMQQNDFKRDLKRGEFSDPRLEKTFLQPKLNRRKPR
jgi:hypothetical protein